VLALERAGLVAVGPAGEPAVWVSTPLQAAARATASPELLGLTVRAAADALLEAWPKDQPRSGQAARIRACAASLLRHAGDALWAGGSCHRALLTAGQSMAAARLAGPAVAWWQDVVARCERLLGPDHHDTLPVTGRCPHCKARIGPYALAAELVTALVLAVIAARVTSGWELAALAWLALIAVPLAFIDIAVQRLPDLLTISAFTGTLVLLAAADGAAHQPWLLIRAVIGAAALAGFYLALWLVFPDQLGLGDVKLAASIGLVLAWGSWSELFLGALAGALLGAVYARVLSARRGAGGPVYLPLGPFLLLGALVAIALLPGSRLVRRKGARGG